MMQLRNTCLSCTCLYMISLFKKYISVGVINTAIHWCVFFIVYAFLCDQSISNISGFLVSVTFSFFANTIYTFSSKPNVYKYIVYLIFMGGVAFLFGYINEHFHLSPIIALVAFSIFSLFIGFVVSKKILS
ncbi:MAG: GtrA family protein [Turicibacter sp.]